jgi:hypothetical protein
MNSIRAWSDLQAKPKHTLAHMAFGLDKQAGRSSTVALFLQNRTYVVHNEMHKRIDMCGSTEPL